MDTDLRRLILDRSRVLLVADGYKNISMRKIARAIGYSATSIYLYFENKDALFQALIEEGMDRLHQVLLQASAEAAEDPIEQVRALCRAYADFGLGNAEYYEIMFMLHPEHMKRFPPDKYRKARRNLELFAAVLKEGARKGMFEIEDVNTRATSVWAALHGVVSLLLAERVDARIDQSVLIETTVRQVIHGLTVERQLHHTL